MSNGFPQNVLNKIAQLNAYDFALLDVYARTPSAAPMTLPRIIDERFLRVHPRTALWWEQREQCKRCAHVRHRPQKFTGKGNTNGSGLGMSCAVSPARWGEASCIGARDLGSPCGPDADLFQPT